MLYPRFFGRNGRNLQKSASTEENLPRMADFWPLKAKSLDARNHCEEII